jgi:hypothetical protein
MVRSSSHCQQNFGKKCQKFTIELYSHRFLNYKYTEGVRYVAQKGQAYWLIDTIVAWQTKDSLRREFFQTWKLTVSESEDRTAILEATDGNDKQLVRQKIEYTDFPLPKISFYLCDNILMLPSEY